MSHLHVDQGEIDRLWTYEKKQDYTSQNIGEEIPVTPGIHHTGHTEYFENRPTTSSSEKRAFDPDGATPGPSWNPNRYDDATERSAGVALIKRLAKLSVNDVKDDPVQLFPELGLSGRVISATFTVPYTIGFSPGNDWVRTIARSALTSSSMSALPSNCAGRTFNRDEALRHFMTLCRTLLRLRQPGTTRSSAGQASCRDLQVLTMATRS